MTQEENDCRFLNITSSQTEDTVSRVVQISYISFLGTSIVVGVPGNLLVAAVYGYQENKSATDWLILFAAIFNTLVCGLDVPFHLSFETGMWKTNHPSDTICQLFVWISQSLTLVSCLLMFFLAFDRFQKICFPLKMWMSTKTAKQSSLFSLAASMFVSTPVFLLFGNNAGGQCKVLEKYDKSLTNKIYFTSIFAVFVVIFILVSIFYFLMARKMRQRMLIRQKLGNCLSERKSEPRKQIMHEVISIAFTSNGSPQPSITIQITDSSVNGSMENVSTNKKCLAKRSWSSDSDSSEKSQCSNASPGPNTPTFHDQFLLQVPSSFSHPEAELSSGPPHSTDIFTASTFVSSAKNESFLSEDRKMSTSCENRITAVLFAITLLFILSWILPWYVWLYRYYTPTACPEYHQLSTSAVRYGPQMYLLYHMSNPVVFSFMSRSFRENVKTHFRKLLKI